MAKVQSPTRRKHEEHWTTVAFGVEVDRSVQLKMTRRRAVRKGEGEGEGEGGVMKGVEPGAIGGGGGRRAASDARLGEDWHWRHGA